MKRLIPTACVVICVGLIASTWAQDTESAAAPTTSGGYYQLQADVMECSPPKFLLIAQVDLDAQTLTGMSTIQTQTPDGSPMAYHMTFKLADINVTDARRNALDKTELKTLKGKFVVLSEGKRPLSAVYLGLFREDTVVISIKPAIE